MRALRFASTLDFEIEADTAAAMREKSHLLAAVSAERIFTELRPRSALSREASVQFFTMSSPPSAAARISINLSKISCLVMV